MKIIYYGHACFAFISKEGTTVITDPYTKVGYELPSDLSADVVTTSHGHFDHNYTQAVKAKRIVSQAGRFQVNEVEIIGDNSYHDQEQGRLRGNNIFFKYNIDGMRLCHLGDLGESISSEIISRIGIVDVLFIPVGGTYTLDGTQAKDYARAIGAKVVIPMHYKPQDGALDITSAKPFLQYFEGNVTNALDGVIEISADNLPKSQQVIYMERKK